MKNCILYDLTATQPSDNSKRHGGGKYGEVIIKRILERNLDVACYYDSRHWINPEILELIRENNVVLHDIKDMSLQNIVDDKKYKTVYSALPNSKVYALKNCNIIGTVHGLRRLETPADNNCLKYKNLTKKDFVFYLANKFVPNMISNKLKGFYRKSWSNENLNIVTVSNHTSNSIKVYFPEMREKNIPVFYSPSTTLYDIQERKYNKKFFLLVSGNRFEKNNLRAIKALDYLFSNNYLPDFAVYITGAKDASNYRYKIKNKERFNFWGYVDDLELEQLYHDAYCLIYPSLNEGFGYPPLEAMHYNVPVIASPYTSIPEVCQDSAIYFNPFSVQEIANRILQISDSDIHAEYSKKAQKQYLKITEKQTTDLDKLIDFIYAK